MKNYIAKITGLDGKYGFSREFLPYDVERNMPESEYEEFLISCDVEAGIYEIGTGFNNKYKDIVEYKNGKVSKLTKNEALQIAKSI